MVGIWATTTVEVRWVMVRSIDFQYTLRVFSQV